MQYSYTKATQLDPLKWRALFCLQARHLVGQQLGRWYALAPVYAAGGMRALANRAGSPLFVEGFVDQAPDLIEFWIARFECGAWAASGAEGGF